MKTRFVIPILVAAGMTAAATAVRADPWKATTDLNLTLNQNAYSDNWVGGEAGAISWAFNSLSVAERQLGLSLNNKNTLKLMFGQTHNQDPGTKDWRKPVKSTDLIDFESVFRFTLGWFVDPFASARAETQFLDQSDPSKDRYANPLTVTETVGIARMIFKEEEKEWGLRLGSGLRQHLDRDVLADTLGNRENRTKRDFGVEFVSDYRQSFSNDKLKVSSKLIVFQALYDSESDELEGLPEADYWKDPDINWETIVTASITKYIMVNLYLQVLYDKEIDLGGRFKQTLGLGFTYKLG